MTQSMQHETPHISAPDPDVAALSDTEFAAALYAQGIRFGEVRPTRIPTERQRRRAARRLAKFIRNAEKRELRSARVRSIRP